ncbi:uncharacterized protein V1510DRAFT_410067 [Dipodascopsis tothii]|uniref:uncharacterized protein n=1 Tax=Dipodascopsis tothii TaxID=44089 RepID=UPI0034CD8BE0
MPARSSSPPSISSASSVRKPFRFWHSRQDQDRHSHNYHSSLSSNFAARTSASKKWWRNLSPKKFAQACFAFRPLPVTALAVATYAALLITTYVVQFSNPQTSSAAALAAAPGSGSLAVETAWSDLQIVSKDLHPYNSHANDYVHEYLVNRTFEIYNGSTPGRVELDDYYGYAGQANVTFLQPDIWNSSNKAGKVIYFESNNVLVKVVGSDPNLPAVLVSAHFDSVSTAYGTTDDGTGIVVMLAMLEHYAYAAAPPLRTIIFNFNNAEEFGLLGAEAFFFHPWSSLPSTFYNLEGTGAGGRAVLFRASDYGVASHYSAAPTPHANSVLQQGFHQGVIRSETDYRAYEDHGLRGLDVAFYSPRAVYHTKGDSIQGTTRGSVEHMLTTSIATVDSMANDRGLENGSKSQAVFFDLFGSALFVAPVNTFFIVDTVMLVVSPIILFLLLFGLAKSRKLHLGRRGWARFPVSLVLSTGITFGVLVGLQYANGLIFYSHTGVPFIAIFSLYFVLNYFVLATADRVHPVRHQKLKVLLELFAGWWVVLVYANVMENMMDGTGLYWITFNFIGVSFALLLDIIAVYFEPAEPMYFMATAASGRGETSVANAYLDSHENDIDNIAPHSEHGDEDEDGGSDDSPLLGDDHATLTRSFASKMAKREDYAWLFEFLILVPFSVFLTSQIGFMAIDAVHQTLQEGGPAVYNVYLTVFVFIILLMLPILPFIHRIHFVVAFVLVLTFTGTFLASVFLFPFSAEDPLKVSFIQQIDLDNLDAGAVVTLTGLSPYTRHIAEDLPSTFYDHIYCHPSSARTVERCQYPGLYPNVTDGYVTEWVQVLPFNCTGNCTDNDTYAAPAPADPAVWLAPATLAARDLAVADTEPYYNATLTIFANDSRTCVVRFDSKPFDPFTFTGFAPFNGTNTTFANATVDALADDDYEPKYKVVAVSVSTNYTNYTDFDTLVDEYYEPYAVSYPTGIEQISLYKLDFYAPFTVHLQYKLKDEDEEVDADEYEYFKAFVGCQYAEWQYGKIPALDELDQYRPRWAAVTKNGNGLVEVWQEVNLFDYLDYGFGDDLTA